jgi:hypothetical protein
MNHLTFLLFHFCYIYMLDSKIDFSVWKAGVPFKCVNLANGDDDYCEIYSKVDKKDDALKPPKL